MQLQWITYQEIKSNIMVAVMYSQIIILYPFYSAYICGNYHLCGAVLSSCPSVTYPAGCPPNYQSYTYIVNLPLELNKSVSNSKFFYVSQCALELLMLN